MELPAEIRRAVLAKAGHRCAVCGDPCLLERAQIIPWHAAKEYRVGDLICLCESCRRRADSEAWSEETLREHKQNPWIRRKGGEPDPDRKAKYVQVTLKMRWCDLDVTQQRLFVFAIAAFLDLPPGEIGADLDLPPGEITEAFLAEESIKITVELPGKAAEDLINAFQSRDPFLFEILSHSHPVEAAFVERATQEPPNSPPAGVDKNFDEFLRRVKPRLRGRRDLHQIPEEERTDFLHRALLVLLHRWDEIEDPESWLMEKVRQQELSQWRLLGQPYVPPPEDADFAVLKDLPRDEEVDRYLKEAARRIMMPDPSEAFTRSWHLV